MARSGVARDHGSGSLESRRGRSMARAEGGTPARAPAALLRATRWCGSSAARAAEPEPATSWLQGQDSSADGPEIDRKSVAGGTWVSVRLDLGGRRLINKQKTPHTIIIKK